MRFRKIILSGIISASLAFTPISFASTPQGPITEKSVLEAVEENTKSPGDIESISRLSPSESIELDTKEGLVENKTTDQSITEILSIERTDGFQIVGVINENHRADSEIRVNFPGMHLREIEGGTVLVSNELYGEPEYIIDPAWAEDSIGKEIGTHFEIQGSELVQVINSHESDYTIYADPYVRSGKLSFWPYTSYWEYVLSPEETRKVAFGASLCSLIPHPAATIPCGGVSAIANYALSGGNCLLIRYFGTQGVPLSGRC